MLLSLFSPSFSGWWYSFLDTTWISSLSCSSTPKEVLCCISRSTPTFVILAVPVAWGARLMSSEGRCAEETSVFSSLEDRTNRAIINVGANPCVHISEMKNKVKDIVTYGCDLASHIDEPCYEKTC